MGDCDALFQCPLGEMIEQLPGLFCDIGDCTYTPTEHLVPIFGGALAKIPSNNNFNFYASQRRICSKMAFGVMIQKWGIHQKPLTCKLKHAWKIVVTIACLHNFCINQRLANNVPPCPSAAERTFTVYEEGLRAIAAVRELNDRISNEYPQWSRNRERLVARIQDKGLQRPTMSRNANN